jgi:23S rRNA pseudouridine2605 synthase
MVDHTRQPSPRPAPRQESSEEAGGERVAKALARAGVASRREVERLIEAGRVALNGRVLDTPAVKVAPGDILTVDGAVVANAEPTRLWRYHKPVGLMTTHNDPQGRPTVFQHLPEGLPRVISVGRLDLNSEGLLLLTNDGGLARALELPSSAWVRRYRVRAYGHTSQTKLDALKAGITIEGVVYGPIEARLDKVQTRFEDSGKTSAPANVWITIALSEGKNREVRRVLEAIGLKVNRLIRLAYGPFALGTLPVGAAEEVGPRVVREQLAEFIAPQNLPTGDRRSAPALPAAPLRRGATPVPTGRDGEARPSYGQGPRRPGNLPRPPRKGIRPQAADPRESREAAASASHGKTLLAPASLPRKGPRPQTATAEGVRRDDRKAEAEPREKKAYKAGWAKPKPKPRPAPAGSKPKRRGPPKAR